MKSILLAIIFIGTSLSYLHSQKKQDYYWPMGLGSSSFVFEYNKLPMTPDTLLSPFKFRRTMGAICDSEGELLFYSNGCRVADRRHEVMPNSDSLNFNCFYEKFFNDNDCLFGYIEKQGIAILPDPGNDEGYYIFHKPLELFLDGGIADFWQEYILYSYVDMTLNNGYGEMIVKNDTLFNRKNLQASHMAVINHSNGKDWWILQPGDIENGNRYYRILIDETGVAKIDSQAIGPIFIKDEWPLKSMGGGQSKFSPDGKKYAYFNLYDGLHLYDFDRSTGLLSGGQYIEWSPTDQFQSAGSVEFSPDSRLLYLTNEDELFQLDLEADDLEASLLLIDTWDGASDPFGTIFFMMALAPDCKIYVRPGSSSNVFHTIHNPNGRGQDCGFVQRDLQLPQTSSAGGFPNFPHFRVDEEEKCDSSITMVDGLTVFWRKDLKVYPNPVATQLTITIPDTDSGHMRMSRGGQILWEEVVMTGTMSIHKDISTYTSGIYELEFLPDHNRERRIYTAMVMVE